MTEPCKFEEDIGFIKATLTSIESSLKDSKHNIESHINQGDGWRKAIIGIIFAGVMQIVTFAYYYGQLSSVVYTTQEMMEKHVVWECKK